MSESFGFTGRLALVTGSTRGIGRALATALAHAGASVVIHGRNQSAVDQAVQEAQQAVGSPVHGVAFDVNSREAIRDGVREVRDSLGDIDILVNNAGIQVRAPFVEFADEDWDRVVAINLTAPFAVAQAVAPGMISRGAGKIVNISSVQSHLARPGTAPYAATKGGIGMLTRGLCAELGPAGIQVNAIAPGYIETELTAPLVADVEFDAWIKKRTPAGRWGQVSDLVGVLTFLCSPASDFINGQTIFVDGGMTAVV